jgi:hypothetical protein
MTTRLCVPPDIEYVTFVQNFLIMKTIITLAGILLIAGGCYFIYDGYQAKQSAVAQVEQGISSAIRSITDNSVKPKTNVNNESAMKMVGGGVAVITGILLLAGGLRRKRR